MGRNRTAIYLIMIIALFLALAFELSYIEDVFRTGNMDPEEKCEFECLKEGKIYLFEEGVCYCKEPVSFEGSIHCFHNVTFRDDPVFEGRFDTSSLRNMAVSSTVEYPDPNSYAARIFSIYKAVGDRISYVSDPRQDDYVAFPNETWEIMGGDCDDSSVLLSSMYEAVGLDASIVEVRNVTYGHVFVIVRVDQDLDSFLEGLKPLVEGHTPYFGEKPFNFLVFRDKETGCTAAKGDFRLGIVPDHFYVMIESTARGYPGKQDPFEGYEDIGFINIGA